MSEKIQPPVSPQEWARPGRRADECVEMLKVANKCLPKADPQKFTREDVDACKRAGLKALADRIETLLPRL